MIELSDLRVQKGGRTVCSVAKLEIAAGERVAVVGANGSGKSTLLRVLAGLESKYQGHCHVEAPWRDRVYVHQSPCMFRGSVRYNILYGLRLRTKRYVQRDRVMRCWLERFGLTDLAARDATRLSGGEKRRVALARAMIWQPRVLLLDEPLVDLDAEGVAVVSTALAESPHTTVLIASPGSVPDGLTSRTYPMQ